MNKRMMDEIRLRSESRVLIPTHIEPPEEGKNPMYLNVRSAPSEEKPEGVVLGKWLTSDVEGQAFVLHSQADVTAVLGEIDRLTANYGSALETFENMMNRYENTIPSYMREHLRSVMATLQGLQ